VNLLEPDEASDVTTAKLGRCPGCGCRPESDDAFEFVELLISEPQPWAAVLGHAYLDVTHESVAAWVCSSCAEPCRRLLLSVRSSVTAAAGLSS